MFSTRPTHASATSRVLRRLPLLTSFSALLGCQPTVEEVVAEHRAAVEPVFAKLEALDAKVKATPAVTEDAVKTGSEPIVLDGEGSNALFILAEDLAAPTKASTAKPGTIRAAAVENCGSALRGEFIGAPGGAKLYLEECARAKYVFVLRTEVSQAAHVADENSFAAGDYAGEVLLFRLADAELLGGFRVGAKSSDTVQVLKDDLDDAQAVDARLEKDLGANVFVDIDARLRAHVPGVIPD